MAYSQKVICHFYKHIDIINQLDYNSKTGVFNEAGKKG